MTDPDAAPLADAVHRTARDLHERALAEPGNVVASPVGAWLLLAQVAGRDASAHPGPELAEAALGMPVADAHALANRLLAAAPAELHTAAAAWIDGAALAHRPKLAAWADDLAGTPTGLERELPTQAALDAWARDHTQGLIDTFPLELDPDTVLVVANALAAKVEWREPFETDLNGEPGWAVDRVLATDTARLVRVDGVLYAVVPQRSDDLRVLALVADDPATPAATVLDAAAQLAASGWTGDTPHPLDVDPRDVPAHGTVYEVSEAESSRPEDLWSAALPAWTAERRHELDVTPVVAAVQDFGDDRWQAAQAVLARYDVTGFEAAAVSAAMVLTRSVMPTETHRVLSTDVVFRHPFAVVATAVEGAWAGLPVFTAWVRDAREPTLG